MSDMTNEEPKSKEMPPPILRRPKVTRNYLKVEFSILDSVV